MIKATTLLTQPIEKATEFCNDLTQTIDRQQGLGLIVEIQYQFTDNGYSALIIGRDKEASS